MQYLIDINNGLLNILNYLSGATLILAFLVFIMYSYKLSAVLGVITVAENEIKKGFIDSNNEVYRKEKVKAKKYKGIVSSCILLMGISAICNVIVHLLK